VQVRFSCNNKFLWRKCCEFSAINRVITSTECIIAAVLEK
jgi:hypothetical protein